MAKKQHPFDPLDDFEKVEQTFLGSTKTVYRKGAGPAVIIMSEIPGITPKVADFARRVVELGCTVAMPSLYGVDGRRPTSGYLATSASKVCVSQEFTTFTTGKSSPVIVWLRALARQMHKECGGPGVGAVGMCLTGGFALAMMVDEEMIAPVLSQPSTPFALSKKHKADLGISPTELKVVKERVEAGVCVVGLRFTEDPLSPPERFESLRRELGEGFIGVEIDSSPGNAHGFEKKAHSVLTEDLVDEPGHPTHDALNLVLDHLRDRLLVQ